MEEAYWRRRLCSIPSVSIFSQQIRLTHLKTHSGAKSIAVFQLILFQFALGSKIRRRWTLSKWIALDRWLWWLLSWAAWRWVHHVIIDQQGLQGTWEQHVAQLNVHRYWFVWSWQSISRWDLMVIEYHWQGWLCGELLCEAGLWVRRRGKQVTIGKDYCETEYCTAYLTLSSLTGFPDR